MPWKAVKRNCKQANGRKGSYVVVKKKSKGRTEQESCHTSKKKSKAAVRARYASKNELTKPVEENVVKITRRQLKQLIVEMMTPDNMGVAGEKKNMFVLVGPPSVGKSRWIDDTFDIKPYIISRDDIVLEVADQYGWTYDDMFAGPPEDAVIGDVHPEYGEVVAPPSYMTWASSVYSKVNEANAEVHNLYMQRVSGALPSGQDIIVDMTNMNKGSRSRALNAIDGHRDDYEKIAVVFEFQGAEQAIRKVADIRSKEENKTIPSDAFDRMFSGYEPVSLDEGFDAIINVDNRSILRDLANKTI